MSKEQSFYFFDFDDNIMFLDTPIFIKNMVTKEIKSVSTGDFANIHPLLGKSGEWVDYGMFDDSYSHFRDIPETSTDTNQEQYFVRDIKTAIADTTKNWKAPAWNLFVYACNNERPVSIVTARGHSPETLKAGVDVLLKSGLIAKLPNYLTIFPVGNDDVRHYLGDKELEYTTPALKKRAIIQTVETALENYGTEPEHRFGMSDDDPANVSLIISAMCVCKKKYEDKRFFVINTHHGEKVKLEIFPDDMPVPRYSGKKYIH